MIESFFKQIFEDETRDSTHQTVFICDCIQIFTK